MATKNRPLPFFFCLITVTVTILSVGTTGCRSSQNSQFNEPEPLTIDDLNPFKATHPIVENNPSMEKIVQSMNFLRREDPFEMMRYWVAQGFNGEWKGDDWIDLFEGDGEYQPIAIERIPNSEPLTVKVITWARKSGPRDGSPYDIPYLRHEYLLELEKEGWRRKQKTIKPGPSVNDHIYLYDSRVLKPQRLSQD